MTGIRLDDAERRIATGWRLSFVMGIGWQLYHTSRRFPSRLFDDHEEAREAYLAATQGET